MDANVRYAGFWIRVLARIIDVIIIYAGVFGAAFVIGFISGVLHLNIFNNPANKESIDTAFGALYIIVVILYYILFESSHFMGTPGKMIVGIKIIDEQGQRISLSRATGRYFSKILSSLPLFAGFIMVAFHPQKRGLHDLIAKTFAVYRN